MEKITPMVILVVLIYIYISSASVCCLSFSLHNTMRHHILWDIFSNIAEFLVPNAEVTAFNSSLCNMSPQTELRYHMLLGSNFL